MEKVEEEELQAKIDSPDYSNFDKRRFELELKKKQIYKPFNDKLFNDALKELNVSYETILKPGDMLYLPSGKYHKCKPLGKRLSLSVPIL